MNKNIGFMQGRLSPLYQNKIQCFPKNHWENEFEIANKIGLKTMEWTLDYEELIKNPLLNKSGQEKIKLLSKKYNISITSITGDCFMQKPYWKESNDQIRCMLNNQFDLICSSCKILGIKFLVIPLVDNGKLENSDQVNILIEWLNSKKYFLKDCGIMILFEIENKPKDVSSFINNFELDIFGINYDIGNSAALGYDPNEEFELYGKRVKNVHVKDRTLGGSTVPLGDGNANFEKVFKNLSNTFYEGNFIMQTARAINGEHTSVLKKYGFMIDKWIKEFKIGI